MKDFVIQNWSFLVEVLLAVISVIIILFKKAKVVSVDTPFEKLLEKLPELIKKAEILSKEGKVKRSYVLGVAYAYLADLTGKPVEEISGIYCDRIMSAIEKILETPQKKGQEIYVEEKND